MPKGYVTPREIICGGCQKPFMATGTRSRFCSRKCIDKEQWDRKHRKEVICKQCGVIVTRNYSRFFCSEHCKQKSHHKSPTRKKYFIVRYRLTQERYDQMISEQNNSCAICKKSFDELKKICIDHDHSCCKIGKSCGGCIRGLLCDDCNNGLGRFKDSIESLQSAIDYLTH